MRRAPSLKLLLVIALIGFQAAAQDKKSVAAGPSKASKVLGSQMTTILNFGLAGGALGLSTLSFYGRPQDKLAHIPVGLALGIITGAIVSTSQVVTDPSHLSTELERETRPEPETGPLAFQWTIDF